MIINPGRRNMGMPEPLLHLGVVSEGVGSGGGARRMSANLNSQSECVPSHQPVESIGCDGVVEPTRAVITHRAEEGALGVRCVMRFIEIVIEKLMRARV
jgi:hypothetical protein